MKHELKRLEKNAFELTLIIPWSDVQTTYDRVFEEVAKNAEIAGFRKGKAPKDLVAQNVNKNKLYEEVIKELLPKAYSEAVQKENLKPIITPVIETVEINQNKDWVFKARACEMPNVLLKDYKKAISDTNAKDKIWVPGKDTKAAPEEDKNKLADDRFSQANKRFAQNMDILLKTSEVELPDLLIEQELSRLLSELLEEIKRLGLTLDQYLASTNKTLEVLRQEYREKAKSSLKLEFLLEKIAEEEKITVDEKDIDKTISDAKDDKTRAALNQNRYQLASIIKRQKTLDFLSDL